MTAPRRKLSFLGYAPPGVADDDAAGDLRLDEEMQRAVWGAAEQEEDAGGGGGEAGGRRGAAGSRKLSLQERRRSAPERDAEAAADSDAESGDSGAADGGAGAGHAGFVQLDELALSGAEGGEWRQQARWIKYEQDVEEDAERWGRPHVASLSFHSLLNLRRCLEDGVVLLGLRAEAGAALWAAAADALQRAGLLAPAARAPLLRALQLRHSRPHERSKRFSLSSRKHSSYSSLQSADGKRRRSSGAPPPERKRSLLGALAAAAAATAAEEPRRSRADSVLRRIPAAAEASLVLVGVAPFLPRPVAVFVRLAQALPLPDVTEVPLPVRFAFVLMGPADAELDYREVGRSLAALMANPGFHALASRADERRELLSGINEFLDDSIVLPPGDWERQALLPVDELRAKSQYIRRRKHEALQRRASVAAPAPPDERKALLAAREPKRAPDDQLARTGRPFGGMLRDARRRYPHYASDLRDGLNAQCGAATVFMYFAALSSAITFGGLYADKTQGAIGISETLLATSAGGVLFALLAGQPLMITGATGPLLLLDDSLAAFCRGRGLDLLAARCYAGAWMLLIALLVAAAEGSVAVKKITRFTEDIFAFLICLIFIWEPITNTISLYRAHPLSADYCADDAGLNGTSIGNATAGQAATLPQPNTALFSTMLTLGTFVIAYYLRLFRNGKFLGRSARRALGDFGVPLAIVLMAALAAGAPVWTPRLRVPAGLRPSAPRAWLVPRTPGFAALPAWAALGAALPALMVYIIVFLETHIAELIVDKPERRLHKGSGFHMDIVVMSAVNAACGLFGAPWQCVATVRSVSHVVALTELSTTHAPGDKPHIVRVREQRVTALGVAALVGASVLAARWLRLVPLAVLFGVFLYMGVSALAGIQLWERCVLLLQPVKHHPPVAYVRRVPTPRMHAYTLLQLAALAALLAVKASAASLALPLLLAAMVPLRLLLLPLCFTRKQLRALDGKQPDLDKDDEPDFYEEALLPG